MKRAIVVAISVILALVLAAPTLLARSDNGKAPQPVSADFIVEAGDPGGSCDFDIRLEVSGKGKTITQPDGSRILTSPGLKVTLTNTDPVTGGEQARFSISGAFHETTDPVTGEVTTKVTGRNLLFDPDAGIVLLSGNFSFVFAADGTLIQPFEGKGRVIDVCELLS